MSPSMKKVKGKNRFASRLRKQKDINNKIENELFLLNTNGAWNSMLNESD